MTNVTCSFFVSPGRRSTDSPVLDYERRLKSRQRGAESLYGPLPCRLYWFIGFKPVPDLVDALQSGQHTPGAGVHPLGVPARAAAQGSERACDTQRTAQREHSAHTLCTHTPAHSSTHTEQQAHTHTPQVPTYPHARPSAHTHVHTAPMHHVVCTYHRHTHTTHRAM